MRVSEKMFPRKITDVTVGRSSAKWFKFANPETAPKILTDIWPKYPPLSAMSGTDPSAEKRDGSASRYA